MILNEQCDHLQKEELYSLSTIYLSDFEFVRQVHPYACQIIVAPFVPHDFFHHESIVFCRILIDFPNDYPLKSQAFKFEIQGLSKNFQQEFQQRAIKVCESIISIKEKESDPQPIVFAVVEALREYVYDQSVYLQELYDIQNSKSDDNYIYIPPMPKFATFTPVTIESFMIWKKKYDQELYEIKKREKNFSTLEEQMKKISGRQYFDKKQQAKDDEQELVDLEQDDDIEELQEEDYSQQDDESDEEYKPLYEREELD